MLRIALRAAHKAPLALGSEIVLGGKPAFKAMAAAAFEVVDDHFESILADRIGFLP